MKFEYLATLALAAATASALPSHVEHAKRDGDTNSEGVVTKTPPAPTNGPSCDYKNDRESLDGVKKIIDYTAFPSSLDINLNIIRNKASGWVDPDGWLNAYWKLNFPKDQDSTLDNCASITMDCHLPKSTCSEFPNANAYWIFLSVQAIHDKLKSAQTTLFQKGFLASLSIDKMKSDFDIPKPDNSWLKWVGVGLAFAGNIGTAADIGGGVAAGVGAASNFFSNAAANDNVANVNTAEVEDKLSNILQGVSNYLSDTLATVMGNKKYPYDQLPDLSGAKLNNSISRFIADPSWLVGQSNDNSSLGVVFDKFGSNIKTKLVDMSLGTAYYVLLGDTKITEEGKCTGKGHYWLDGHDGKNCFYLVRTVSTQCKNNDLKTCGNLSWWKVVPDDVYDKMDKYGLGKDKLKSYYQSLIDCHTNGNGGLDAKQLGVNGIPRCYYDLYVRSGYWTAGRKTNPASDDSLWLFNGLVKVDSSNKVVSSTRPEKDPMSVN